MAAPTNPHSKRPLYQRTTVLRIAGVFGIVLLLSLAVQWLVTVEAHFPGEGVFGAAAFYGFATCAVMVVFAWLLGKLLKRPENYYQTDESGAEEDAHD